MQKNKHDKICGDTAGFSKPFAVHCRRSLLARSLLALAVPGIALPALGQDKNDADSSASTDTTTNKQTEVMEEVLVRGIRSSIQSAQAIKRQADNIVDSIVAEDIGKLPDRSIAEAIQRVPGVAVSRFDDPGDPEHFAGEGAGVSIRGLPQVRAELNGRDIFSAADGRSLSFDDVPAELMAGVDVIKTPTADMVEGGLGGIVNLRTRMPFDEDDKVFSATLKANRGDVIGETNLEGSFLFGFTAESESGSRFGLLIDLSTSEISSRADNLYNRAYFTSNEQENGATVWVPKGADWRRNDFYRQRDGQYLAWQYAPNDNLEFYFTGFRSVARRDWYENAFFIDAGIERQRADIDAQSPGVQSDWVVDANNALVSGTLSSPNGFALGTSSRLSANESETADYSAGLEWRRGPLLLSLDYQRVDSTATRKDDTLGTVVFPEKVRVAKLDSDDGPSITDTDNYLTELGNYSYGQMMTRPARNQADADALRFDAEYEFEDSLIRSVKAGARYAKKNALNSDLTNWSARVQPWNLGTWDGNPPTVSDQRLMESFVFDNFQRGDAQVPLQAWMFRREALDDFVGTTEVMIEATPGGCCAPNYEGSATDPAANISHPLAQNFQEETSQALYIRTDFDISQRFSGNFGLRYIETENTSIGHFISPGAETDAGGDNVFTAAAQTLQFENAYSHFLPSLNLRYDLSEDVVLRFSASEAIWKPEFNKLAALWTLSVDWKEGINERTAANAAAENFNFTLSTNDTNPLLEPMTAQQYDISAEWYFNEAGGNLYGALFYKDIQDFFRKQNLTTTVPNFNVSVDTNSVVNVGEATVRGIEIGGTYYFDNLPSPFDGFGITANLTRLDSKADVPNDSGTEPVDTDGSIIENLPLEGLADTTYNLTFMYEKYGFFARLAYNYSSEIFQSIGPNGWNGNDNDVVWKLPIFADEYGQLDLTMGYNVTDNLIINFEAYNISQSNTRGVMKQNQAGDHTAFVYSQDTRYGLSVRYTF